MSTAEDAPQPPKVISTALEISANLRRLKESHDPLIITFHERSQRFQSYYIFWSTFVVASALIVSWRWLYDRAAEELESSFGHERRAVIVGNNDQIEAVAEALNRGTESRIKAIGFIALEPRPENGLRNLGNIDEIEQHFDEIDEVIIADPYFPQDQAVVLVDRCHRGGVHLHVAPTTMEILRADEAEFVPGETLPLFEI